MKKIKNIDDLRKIDEMLVDEFMDLFKKSNVDVLNKDYEKIANMWILLINEMRKRPSVFEYSLYFVLLWCIVKDLKKGVKHEKIKNTTKNIK